MAHNMVELYKHYYATIYGKESHSVEGFHDIITLW